MMWLNHPRWQSRRLFGSFSKAHRRQDVHQEERQAQSISQLLRQWGPILMDEVKKQRDSIGAFFTIEAICIYLVSRTLQF